jgi:hypothetical protein
MRFPSRGGRLLLLLFGISLGPFLLALPATGWLVWTLTPLPKFYLGTYAASSLGANQPRNVTSIQWVLKTAPGRKSIPMLPADAVAGSDRKLPVSLSDQALADGWRGVALSAPEKILSSELAPLLQNSMYDGDSIPRVLGMPLLYGLVGLIFLCLALQKAKDAWGYGLSSWAQRRQEERHGRRTKGPELSRPAWLQGRGSTGIRLRLQGESIGSKLVPWGRSYAIPKRLESSHIMLMGDTGSGKSSAIRQILRQVKERGDSAIVYDPAMDFVGEFYSPERGDLILNPLDARFPYWSLPDEILNDEIATSIAAALVPEKEYEKAFFTDAPRRVLAHLLRKKPQVRDLLRWMSDPEMVAAMVKGTPLAAYLDPGAPAQRAGILSSMNMVADSLELLPQYTEHNDPSFATSSWISNRKRWVFLTSSSGYREKLLPLHSVWLDLFILRMMGHCPDAQPVWFVLDELASLNKLPQLHTAVTENRKYGNPVVLGFQGRSQLEKRYGQDAEAMLSQPATKVFFRTSEPRAAKWISDAIGEIEVERLKESRSMGLLRSKKSYAMEIATKPLVMASEVAGLDSHRAYIKQENRVVPVRFRLAKKRKKQAEFVERKREVLAPRKAAELPVPAPAQIPAPAQDPPKKPVQSALPLIHGPAAKREGFAWDASQEIE